MPEALKGALFLYVARAGAVAASSRRGFGPIGRECPKPELIRLSRNGGAALTIAAKMRFCWASGD